MAKHSDILVAGGGVIGLACAWRAAQAGVSVTLLERDACGSGASGASLGALMPATATRKGAFQKLQRQSLWTYEQFARELTELSGIDVGYERCGLLDIMHSEQRKEQAVIEAETAAKEWPSTSGAAVMEVLSPEEAHELEPNTLFGWFGARLCRNTARIEVGRLIQALRVAAERSGVSIREGAGAEVTDIAIENGRVLGVRSAGGTVAAGAVLVAAGAWSSQLSPVLERCAPIRPVKGQALLLQSEHAAFRHIIKRQSTYLLPQSNGYVLVGSTTERDAGFDLRTTAAGMAELTADALELVPVLADALMIRMWAGLRPESVERRPMLGAIPNIEGLFIAAGHFKTGISLAPITGRILADLIVSGSAQQDITPFAPNPFATG